MAKKTPATGRLRPLAVGLSLLVLLSGSFPAEAYTVTYKEQFYRLFRMHLQRTPENYVENIYWLQQAVKADFANPLHAIGRVRDEVEWEKYRYLFMMHLNIKLVEQHLALAAMWGRQEAFFYNAPWKEQNLESLEIAEATFRAATGYWEAALEWAELAGQRRLRFVDLPGVQFWADSVARIQSGDLDYARTIRRELEHIERMREQFRAMGPN
ncbi:MAG: hypothetical protein FWD94_08900 [Treponema sp.]|nr:hypothetical protein [Treponema sp.]